MVQLSHLHMTTEKIIALTIWTFVRKVLSLLSNKSSRFVIAFLPRSKHLLILWLELLSAVILEPKKIKFVTVCTFSLFAMKWLVFWMLSFKPAFSLFSFTLIKRLFLHFLPLEWYHLHVWDAYLIQKDLRWFIKLHEMKQDKDGFKVQKSMKTFKQKIKIKKEIRVKEWGWYKNHTYKDIHDRDVFFISPKLILTLFVYC